jgi:hypothetical protein
MERHRAGAALIMLAIVTTCGCKSGPAERTRGTEPQAGEQVLDLGNLPGKPEDPTKKLDAGAGEGEIRVLLFTTGGSSAGSPVR